MVTLFSRISCITYIKNHAGAKTTPIPCNKNIAKFYTLLYISPSGLNAVPPAWMR